MVVLNWAPESVGLVRALVSAMPDDEDGPAVVICVGTDPADVVESQLPQGAGGLPLRYVVAPTLAEGLDGLTEVLASEVKIATARAVIVLPDRHAEEPDAASRLTCAAVGRACSPKAVPNILVEVEDPEAAYEFAGLGVATVFYPGYLRAALLAHACVDLGVFQFVYGLLRGRYRVRLKAVPPALRDGTFFDVACALEEDERGLPQTPIGLQLAPREPADGGSDVEGGSLLINPGPRAAVRDAVGLLMLVESS